MELIFYAGNGGATSGVSASDFRNLDEDSLWKRRKGICCDLQNNAFLEDKYYNITK